MTLIRILTLALGWMISLSAQGSVFTTPLSCGGTEPFWSSSIKGDMVIFNLTGQPSLQEYMIKGLRPTANDGLITWAQLEAVKDGQTAHLVLSDTRKPGQTAGHCNDGMSDRTYPYAIVFKTPYSIYSGCCE